MSFIPKPRSNYGTPEEMHRSYAIVLNQFTGQEHHFHDVWMGKEQEIADSLTRFFSEHPLRSGGMMHPAAVSLLEELGYVLRIENT